MTLLEYFTIATCSVKQLRSSLFASMYEVSESKSFRQKRKLKRRSEERQTIKSYGRYGRISVFLSNDLATNFLEEILAALKKWTKGRTHKKVSGIYHCLSHMSETFRNRVSFSIPGWKGQTQVHLFSWKKFSKFPTVWSGLWKRYILACIGGQRHTQVRNLPETICMEVAWEFCELKIGCLKRLKFCKTSAVDWGERPTMRFSAR